MIVVHEAYCEKCGAILSDDEFEIDLDEIIKNDSKHAEVRNKLKLLNWDYEEAREVGLIFSVPSGSSIDSLDIDEEIKKLTKIVKKKGKVLTKQKEYVKDDKGNKTIVDYDRYFIDHEILIEELLEEISQRSETVAMNGNKIKIKGKKPKIENISFGNMFSHKIKCPVCGNTLVHMRTGDFDEI